MKKIRNISLIGAGAVGAVYGSRFHDMEPGCVKIIADKERIERYSKKGICINDRVYNFNYVAPEEKCEIADLIIVSVKYHDLKQAVCDIKNHVGTDTIIISLMNGISSEEIIGAEYGMDKMLYSMIIAIDAVREEGKIKYTNFGRIYFGEKNNDVHSPKVEAVKELLDRAGINYVIPENILSSLWWKFMLNVGVNQTSAVLKAPYGVFLNVKEAHDLMVSAMKEVIALSDKKGVNLDEKSILEFDNIIRSLSPEGKTSMLQDIEAGRKTEVEMFGGTVCELGKKYGIETPVNDMLFKMIRTIEQMNK